MNRAGMSIAVDESASEQTREEVSSRNRGIDRKGIVESEYSEFLARRQISNRVIRLS